MFDGERSLGVVVAYGDLVCCVVKDGKMDCVVTVGIWGVWSVGLFKWDVR